MKQNWLEIVTIWVFVLVATIILVLTFPKHELLGPFAAVLAGALALVSLIQLFRSEPAGFVRRLAYVGGGSYLILVAATAYEWLQG
ncbi:MAG: hypothetical protein RL101_197 [Actinomycetota bacterium]|jgi:predicted membrane channel-forming protein YqfA (hemolysin III family)